MASREDLHNKLVEILGSNHVYYQTPESVKMEYPAIKYSISEMPSRYANNAKYSVFTCYDVIVIDRLPDNEAIKKILNLPHTSYDRHYSADNLNHDLIKIYI